MGGVGGGGQPRVHTFHTPPSCLRSGWHLLARELVVLLFQLHHVFLEPLQSSLRRCVRRRLPRRAAAPQRPRGGSRNHVVRPSSSTPAHTATPSADYAVGGPPWRAGGARGARGARPHLHPSSVGARVCRRLGRSGVRVEGWGGGESNAILPGVHCGVIHHIWERGGCGARLACRERAQGLQLSRRQAEILHAKQDAANQSEFISENRWH